MFGHSCSPALHRRQKVYHHFAFVLVATLAACSGEPADPARSGIDGGKAFDAGSGTDSGWIVDSGIHQDSGEPFDAGLFDAGALSDAGPFDSGTSLDAGLADAGAEIDAGVDTGQPDGGVNDGAFDLDGGCARLPGGDDNTTRFIVISHPYDAAGMQDNRYQVFSFNSDGGIADTGHGFSMGRSFAVAIHFTPDGRVGLVAQDDGTVGVFKLDASGTPTVIHAGLGGDYYAADLIVGPRGNVAWVIDYGTEANGGGLYPLTIGCDGKVTPHSRWVRATSGSAFTWLGNNGKGLFASKTSLGASASHLQEIDLSTSPPALLGATTVFADGGVLVPRLTTTHDEAFALVPDHSLSHNGRLGIARLNGTSAPAPFTAFSVPNPVWVTMSPFGNAALVVSSDGADNFRRLRYHASNTGTPFVLDAPMTYSFGKPELPVAAFTVERGALKGRVIAAEISALRQLQFTPTGDIVDVSRTPMGSGLDKLIGSFGVTP